MNSLLTSNIAFLGMRLIKRPEMVVDSGDRSWARVRSPGRARRRLKLGHRQNIDIIWAPDPNLLTTADMIIGHPVMIEKLIAATREKPNG